MFRSLATVLILLAASAAGAQTPPPATDVTGGRIADEKSAGLSPNTKRENFNGPRVEGG